MSPPGKISDVSHGICVEPDQCPVVVLKEAGESLALPVIALTRSRAGCAPVFTWPVNDDRISRVGDDPDLLAGRVMKMVDPDVAGGNQVLPQVVHDVDRDGCHTEWREMVVDDNEMEKFVLVPEVCPVVSMTSAAKPMFRPALSEVLFWLGGGGGGGLLRHNSWQWWSQIQRECLSCRSSEVSFRLFFLGKVASDVVGLGVDPSCLRVDLEETLLALLDERSVMNCTVLGVILDGGPMEGAPVLKPIEHSVLEKSLEDLRRR